MYNLSAPGISDSSYFQMYDNGSGYVYIRYADNVSANYSFKQMNEEEIAARNELAAAAPNMVVGEWFSTDGKDLKVTFNEEGTFTISSDSDPELNNYKGYWHFNTISEHQGDYTYVYDIETILEIEGSDNTEDTGATVDMADVGAAMDAVDTEPTEPATYREDYALWLKVKDGHYSLELSSLFVNGTLTNADGLAIIENAAAAITGHWSAETAMDYDRETEQSTERSVDFYLDIAEDGSFTGYLGEAVQGSWRFFEIEDGMNRYLFAVSGAAMDSIYTLDGDILSGYYEPYVIKFGR